MTKEEVKEIFDHNWTKLVNPDYSDDDLAEAQNWVIETLSAEPQGFEDYLKQYLGENDLKIIGNDVWEETKAKAEQTEWISVKDRLPEKNDCYLVTFNFESNGNPDNGIGVVEFYDGNFYSNGFGVNEDVVAWYSNPVPLSPYRRYRE